VPFAPCIWTLSDVFTIAFLWGLYRYGGAGRRYAVALRRFGDAVCAGGMIKVNAILLVLFRCLFQVPKPYSATAAVLGSDFVSRAAQPFCVSLVVFAVFTCTRRTAQTPDANTPAAQ
jgi:hypothetical protein